MSLKKKAISGLIWTFSQQFSVQLINFIVSVILARILTPEEFGLIGILAVFISIGNILIDGGLTSSLIRTSNPDQKDYSTVFLINVVGSILLYIILFYAAPFIAAFFKKEILAVIVRVYGISIIIRAFVAVQTTRLTKQMDFKIQMTMQIPSVIGGGVLGIALAYMGYGVWSLVWMNLFQSFLFTIQHWVFTKWRPNLYFNKERFKNHFSFGYKLTLAGLLETIFQNLYNLIIGKYFSPAQVGYYTRAQSVRQFPIQNISEALNKVTYPMFSTIQDDNEKLKQVYKKLLKQVMFWLTPSMIILIILGEPLFRFLFTEKWLPATPYFQLLCISGITYPLHSYNLNILKVKGRSDLFFKLEIIKKSYTAIGIFLAIPYGIHGLLYFQIASSFAAFYINSFYSGKMINYPFKEQLRDILPSIYLSVLVAVFAWLLDLFLLKALHMFDIGRILIGGGFFFLSYLSMSQLIKMEPLSDFKTLVLRR
jgi:O-antigen/teichoic acid export membrane protein